MPLAASPRPGAFPAPGDHVRHNRGLLAASEKRCLVSLASRMPAWVSSDHLTLLGFLGMLLAGASFWAARLHPLAPLAAIFFLAVNWLGDSLDGTLARVRGRLRPRYGFYVDHVVDVFGAVALCAGLGSSGRMSPEVAAAVLVIYLMLSAEIFLATHALGVFRMSYGLLGPTELRILLAAGVVASGLWPTVRVAGRGYLLFDVAGVASTIALGLILLVSVRRNTRTLFQAEPLARAFGTRASGAAPRTRHPPLPLAVRGNIPPAGPVRIDHRFTHPDRRRRA